LSSSFFRDIPSARGRKHLTRHGTTEKLTTENHLKKEVIITKHHDTVVATPRKQGEKHGTISVIN